MEENQTYDEIIYIYIAILTFFILFNEKIP